jgi:hypothetical protein
MRAGNSRNLGPGAEHDDGTSECAREGDFRERAVLPRKSDQGVAGGGDEDVAGVAETGRQCDGEVAIAARVLVVREQTDHGATGAGGAAGDGLHDAAEAAADEHGSGGRDLPAEGAGEPGRVRRA